MSSFDHLPEVFGQGRDAALAGASAADHPGGSDEALRAWIAGFREYQAHDPLCSVCGGSGKQATAEPGPNEYSAASIRCECNVPADESLLAGAQALPREWDAVQGHAAVALERELKRELHRTHVLAGRRVIAIARGEHPDDILFCPRTGHGPVYYVHLTWSIEHGPGWPQTEEFASLDAFTSEWTSEDED